MWAPPFLHAPTIKGRSHDVAAKQGGPLMRVPPTHTALLHPQELGEAMSVPLPDDIHTLLQLTGVCLQR